MTVAEAKALTPEELYSMTDVWCLPGEEWKRIPNTEFYEASTYGRIRSLDHWVTHKGKSKSQLYIGRILKAGELRCGYFRVSITFSDEVTKGMKIHRLIAMTWLDNSNNYPCINHKDENKHNNRLDNLEYCTHQYNNEYGTGRNKASKSHSDYWVKNGRPVLQYDLKGNFICEYPNERIARETTGATDIYNCCGKRTKALTSGGFIWKYKDNITGIKDNEILCFTINDEYIATYKNATEASRQLGHNGSHSISDCAKGRVKTAFGYKWIYKKNYNEKVSKTKS